MWKLAAAAAAVTTTTMTMTMARRKKKKKRKMLASVLAYCYRLHRRHCQRYYYACHWHHWPRLRQWLPNAARPCQLLRSIACASRGRRARREG